MLEAAVFLVSASRRDKVHQLLVCSSGTVFKRTNPMGGCVLSALLQTFTDV